MQDPGPVVAFGAGMLSFVSPCVLPLVPGYLSLISGMSTEELTHPTTRGRAHLLRSSVLFVIGFTIVFTLLGAGASSIGELLLRHQMILRRVAGALVMMMGLFLAGLVVPAWLSRERRFPLSASRLGGLGAPVMGMSFAFGWTPCIGAVLAPILALATVDATVGRGVVLLFFYSIGLGIPFVAVAVGFQRCAGGLGWFRRHIHKVNLVSGLLLAAFGFLLLTDRVTFFSSRLLDLMDRLGLDWLARS